MSQASGPLSGQRLAALARAAVEARRYAAPEHAALERAGEAAGKALSAESRAAALAAAERLMPGVPEELASAAGGPERVEEKGSAAELLRQRAGLELKLQAEQEQRAEIERVCEREKVERREATEALSLQQRKLKELQAERSTLLAEIGQLESKLRAQINATEQARLKYEKLKSSRQLAGDQATAQKEQINALQAENERLQAALESALDERDEQVAGARGAVDAAEAARAESAFKRLWARMQSEVPEVFVETHVPTEQTFERLGGALVDFVRAFAVLELHVHQMLRDLRQVSEQSDKLNHFYIMFTKNPGLPETLKDYLVSGKRKGNFTNLLRAHQVWLRAFSSGTYKMVVRSPATISEELNYKAWPLKTGFTKTEEAAIGEYFKQTVQKTLPEKLGTRFRRQAADMAYEDYNDLMKRR